MTEEAETHLPKYNSGDMLWGRVSGHPWWPCMVAKGPDSQSHFRTIKRRQNVQVQYHVQYFGEDNERGWISEASLMPYEGRQAFEKLQEEKLNPVTGIPSKKDKQDFVISYRRQRAWSHAVVQAEEALKLSPEDRLALYTFVYPEISLVVDQQTTKTSPKKRKRRSPSRSSNDRLSVDRTLLSNLSDSETGDGEPEQGNINDSNSEAVSLAKTGVRSGRAIKHTTRFARHLNDIMKKKSRTSKNVSPPSSQNTSLDSSTNRDLPTTAAAANDLKTERLEWSPNRQKLVTSNPVRIPPPAATNHDAHIKVEPIADPFVEAQMLQHLQHQRMLYHNSEQQQQRPPRREQLFESPPFYHIQPLDQQQDDNNNRSMVPPKKRQKLASNGYAAEENSKSSSRDFGQKVIVISPLPESNLESSPVFPIVASPSNSFSETSPVSSVNFPAARRTPLIIPPVNLVVASITTPTTTTTCTMGTNTDIDMKWFDQFVTKVSRREAECQTLSPFEELNLDDDDDDDDNFRNSNKKLRMKDADANGIKIHLNNLPTVVNNTNDVFDSRNTNEPGDIDKFCDGSENENDTIDDDSKDIIMETIDLDSIDDDDDYVDDDHNLINEKLPPKSDKNLPNIEETNTKLVKVSEGLKTDTKLSTLTNGNDTLTDDDDDDDPKQNNDSDDHIPISEDDFQDGDENDNIDEDDDNIDEEDDNIDDDEDDNIKSAYVMPATFKAKYEVDVHPFYGVMLKANATESSVRSLAQEKMVENYISVPPRTVCHHCEGRSEDLVTCQGPCKGAYHVSCIDLSSQDRVMCTPCTTGIRSCFKCKGQLDQRSEDTSKCNVHLRECGKFYHKDCLQQISLAGTPANGMSTSSCPRHVCTTCATESGRIGNVKQLPKGPLYSCIKCPRSFHFNPFCLPASSNVVGGLDIICSAHFGSEEYRKCVEFSCDWCAVCLEGDKCEETTEIEIVRTNRKQRHQSRRLDEILVTCGTCPLSFHPSCCKMSPSTNVWSCKECLNGRVVCHGDIVWAKMSNYRWWPGRVLSAVESEDFNMAGVSRGAGDVAVYFYGTNLTHWVPWYRLVKFENGEHLGKEFAFKSLANSYEIAIKIASETNNRRIEDRQTELSLNQKLASRPAPYKHVKVNIPLGGVEIFKAPPFENPACQCAPDEDGYFCGPDSDCINRLMLYECHPMVCQGQNKCLNQRFTKRQDANVKPIKTKEKGWGLFAQSPIVKGQFIGEYVGDLIDSKECKRRLEEAQVNGIKNFYMLTLDKNRIIDAGPKGNYTRFLNHCCDPNSETQKWTVCGDIRVGLFASKDIPTDAELNFNYNLDCFGNEKTKCRCGTDICSGFLGVRPKPAAVVVEMEHKDVKKETVTPQHPKKRGRKPKLNMSN